ncbi:MAG: response regulator transcription factor [Flavobacteriaceae bacterium]|nr:response regulator transcription factor [Flavobacteriaceae bacterium]
MKKFKPKILIAEDNYNFGSILKDYLTVNNYSVTLAKNGVEAMTFYSKEKFDLCILDIMMPKMDGFTLAEKIRQMDESVPIFFLTAKNLKADMLHGYKTGADDYLTKPFDSEVLLAKINRILRARTNELLYQSNHSQEQYEIGNYLYNSRTRVIEHINGEKIELSPKENDLLRLFAIFKDELLTRELALNSVWKNNNFFTSRSMDVYIVRLRKIFERDSSVKIKNVHGLGFSMVTESKEDSKKQPIDMP